MEADEFAGVFRHKDLIPIIKLAGLYKTEYTKAYKIELLSAAASIYKVPRGDLSLFLEILNREGYWWTPVCTYFAKSSNIYDDRMRGRNKQLKHVRKKLRSIIRIESW